MKLWYVLEHTKDEDEDESGKAEWWKKSLGETKQNYRNLIIDDFFKVERRSGRDI